jgi:hypothetical protein
VPQKVRVVLGGEARDLDGLDLERVAVLDAADVAREHVVREQLHFFCSRGCGAEGERERERRARPGASACACAAATFAPPFADRRARGDETQIQMAY